MGFLDLLFGGSKKKERERQERLHLMQTEKSKIRDREQESETSVFQNPLTQNRKEPFCEVDLSEIASQLNMSHNIGDKSTALQLCSVLYKEVSPYKSGGKALINLSASKSQCVGLAFTTMALCYSFGDEDINSVAAENAFYCLSKNLIETNNKFAAPAIFTIMQKGSKLMSDKLIRSMMSLAQKQVGAPISIMLGGNPLTDPGLEEFRQQAIMSVKDFTSYYVLLKFYDIANRQYLIPTDMPYYIPQESDIATLVERIRNIPSFESETFDEQCKQHFMSVYDECEKTLRQF